jgi:hypothetical protein
MNRNAKNSLNVRNLKGIKLVNGINIATPRLRNVEIKKQLAVALNTELNDLSVEFRYSVTNFIT